MTVTQIEPTDHPSQGRLLFRPWRESALFAMILMEMSWVTMWYRVFVRPDQKIPYFQALVVLAGLLISTYIINRVLVLLDVKMLIRRLILLLVLVLSMFIGLKLLLYPKEAISLAEFLNRPVRTFRDMANLVPAEFVVMLFILLICWRGLSYSDYHIGPVNALSGFRLGIVMFFLIGLILPFVNETPYLGLYLFLFFSLFSMTAARVSVLSQLRGGHNIQFNRQWMLGITIVILGMIGISVLVAYFAREQIFNILSMLMSWGIYLVVLLFSPLLFLFLQLLIWFFQAIRVTEILEFFVQTIKNLQSMVDALISSVSNWLNQYNIDRVGAFFEYLAGLKPLYMWGLLILVIAVVLLGLRRYKMKEDPADEQDMQTEILDENMFRLLRSTLRRGLDKLVDNLDDLLRLRNARRLLAAARIRRIYAMLLGLSARLDNPRPASRTPLEFLPQIEAMFPALSRELTTITEAYLLVRYGEVPESGPDLERVESAWKRVSSAGKERLKAKRRAKRV